MTRAPCAASSSVSESRPGWGLSPGPICPFKRPRPSDAAGNGALTPPAGKPAFCRTADVGRYLDGLRWNSWVGSLLQVGRQVLIHVLKDQSEFRFPVGPRDRAYIKQPRSRGTYVRDSDRAHRHADTPATMMQTHTRCTDADIPGENACRHRLSWALRHIS